MTRVSDERGAEMRQLFFETAAEMLQSLNEEALKLEKHPGDSEITRSIRRIVHTLKGDAAACGFRELSELAHELEDALALETAASHAALAEVAFAAADTFEAMLTAYSRKGKLPATDSLRKMVRKVTGQPSKSKRSKKKPSEAVVVHTTWTEYEKLAIQRAAENGNAVYHVAAQIDPGCVMPIAARQLVLNALSTLGQVLATRPEANSPGAKARLDFLLATNRTAEQIVAKSQIPTVIARATVDLMKSPAQAQVAPRQHTREVSDSSTEPDLERSEEAESTAKLHSGMPAENILRVDAERIDNVLNLVGELIIGKSMLQQSLNELAKRYPQEAIRGRFADAMALQARVLGDLQRSVMKIRMVPVEQLFRRFPRLVRDVSRQCNKTVELVISGEATDLDKSLLDAIAEPLTHLVRNAISHGIEDVESRVASGKPPQGTIRLDAYHQGNQVIVEVKDDGRGIDVQKVRSRALAQSIVTSEEAAQLSDVEALELVFKPGFSTAEEITEIAGRGVGLDVVQSVLARLKGTVEVDNRPGQSTTFRLKLPLTLAIIKALMFRVEQRLYAIPLNAVAEIARARESDLHQVDNCEVLQMRNQVLSLLRLGRPRNKGPNVDDDKIFVLVISAGDHKLGLIVDSLEGEEELVIKALDDQTVPTDLVSGASILGDGRVVLILNLAAVMERHIKSRPNEAGTSPFGLLLSHADRARIAMDIARDHTQGRAEVRS